MFTLHKKNITKNCFVKKFLKKSFSDVFRKWVTRFVFDSFCLYLFMHFVWTCHSLSFSLSHPPSVFYLFIYLSIHIYPSVYLSCFLLWHLSLFILRKQSKEFRKEKKENEILTKSFLFFFLPLRMFLEFFSLILVITSTFSLFFFFSWKFDEEIIRFAYHSYPMTILGIFFCFHSL